MRLATRGRRQGRERTENGGPSERGKMGLGMRGQASLILSVNDSHDKVHHAIELNYEENQEEDHRPRRATVHCDARGNMWQIKSGSECTLLADAKRDRLDWDMGISLAKREHVSRQLSLIQSRAKIYLGASHLENLRLCRE